MSTVRLILATLLLVLACSVAPGYALANSQAEETFVKENGYPDLFILTFLGEGLDPVKKKLTVFSPPKRIEVWLYLSKGFRVKFVDGAQGEIVKFDPKIGSTLLPGTKLKPDEFDPKLTEEQIQKRFGKPDEIERLPLGASRFLDVYRYLTPALGIKSFTFRGKELVGVVAGFQLVYGGKKDKPES